MSKFTQFNSIVFVLFSLLFFSHTAVAEEISLHKKDRHLTVTIKNKNYHYPNYFSEGMSLFQGIDFFNKKRALHSTSYTRSHSEIYLTLNEQSLVPKLDCLYAYYTNIPTEIRTNIAVCGIDKNLTAIPTDDELFPDTQFNYLYGYLPKLYDIDKIERNLVATLNNGKKIRLKVASVDNFTVFYQFRNWDDIVSDQYTVGIKDNEKEYLWDSVTCFVNYSSSLKFNGLSFVTDTEKQQIKTLSITNLKEILSREGKPLNPHFTVFNLEKASDVSPIN